MSALIKSLIKPAATKQEGFQSWQRVVWIRLVLIEILLLQILIISIPLTNKTLNEKVAVAPELPFADVTLDTQVIWALNATFPNPLFRIHISDPGLYNFTLMSLRCLLYSTKN